MKAEIDLLGELFRNAVNRFDFLYRRVLKALHAAETGEKPRAALRADPLDILKLTPVSGLRAAGASR